MDQKFLTVWEKWQKMPASISADGENIEHMM